MVISDQSIVLSLFSNLSSDLTFEIFHVLSSHNYVLPLDCFSFD